MVNSKKAKLATCDNCGREILNGEAASIFYGDQEIPSGQADMYPRAQLKIYCLKCTPIPKNDGKDAKTKCPGCGKEVTFKPTPEALAADKADDASHELECPNCGYRTANLITLEKEQEETTKVKLLVEDATEKVNNALRGEA